MTVSLIATMVAVMTVMTVTVYDYDGVDCNSNCDYRGLGGTAADSNGKLLPVFRGWCAALPAVSLLHTGLLLVHLLEQLLAKGYRAFHWYKWPSL